MSRAGGATAKAQTDLAELTLSTDCCSWSIRQFRLWLDAPGVLDYTLRAPSGMVLGTLLLGTLPGGPECH